MNQKGVWIKGSWFTAKAFADTKTTLIKSGLMKSEDRIMQGYKPEQNDTGVLYSWKNMPIAYYDIPTLNNMIFSKKLWESIHENPYIKAALDNHCFWGEDQHRDNSEVLLENVAIRVNDFWIGDNNLLLGNVDLMDTPRGLTIYSLAKTGMIGTSSRGFGDLIDIGNGLTRVDEDTYLAVSQDVVGFPAVPAAFCVSVSGSNDPVTQSIMDLETGLREQITSAIEEAYQKYPTNDWIATMFNNLHLEDKQTKVFPLASSVNLKNRFPSNKSVKSSLKKYPTIKGVKDTFKK